MKCLDGQQHPLPVEPGDAVRQHLAALGLATEERGQVLAARLHHHIQLVLCSLVLTTHRQTPGLHFVILSIQSSPLLRNPVITGLPIFHGFESFPAFYFRITNQITVYIVALVCCQNASKCRILMKIKNERKNDDNCLSECWNKNKRPNWWLYFLKCAVSLSHQIFSNWL